MADTRRTAGNRVDCAESGFILTAIAHAYIIPRLMQTAPLPDKIDPWRLTAEGGRLEGALALASLPRLAAELEHAEGEVRVALATGVDAQGFRHITGRLQTGIALICQRCLGPLQWPLDIAVSLALVRNETMADRLPEQYEPLLVADGLISVADLVEDELLLALPLIPLHNHVQECATHVESALAASEPVPNAGQGQPFASLASLLQNTQATDKILKGVIHHGRTKKP